MHGVLTAAVEHGPGMHGPLLIALFLVAVVGGVVYGVRQLVLSRRAGRARSDRGPETDRSPEA